MRKIFLMSIFLVAGCLTGCTINSNDPTPISVDLSEYDIDNNPEYVAYYGEKVTTESFNFKVKYNNWGMMAYKPGLHFEIETNSKDINEYKVFQADITDLEGNVVHQFISSPVKYLFNAKNYGHSNCTYILDDDFTKQFNRIAEMQYRYEVRIITEKANFVFHLWDKEKEGESTGKNKEEYDLSNNAEFTSTKDNSIKVEIEKIDNEEHYRTFGITRYSGIWTGNFIVFCVYDNGYVFDDNGERSMELVDFFLTDEQGGNKKTLISEPLKFTWHHTIKIKIVDEDKTFYESLENKVNIHVITSKEILIFPCNDML